MITRRQLSFSALSLLPFAISSSGRTQTPIEPYPSPTALKPGDLLWPKRPGAYVPYDAQALRSPDLDRQVWESEKSTFIANIDRKAPHMSAVDRTVLQNLTFDEFYKRYTAGDSTEMTPYGAGAPIYVGHVAIVQIKGMTPWIIEAIAGGVSESRYSDWIAARPGERVWQGRLRDVSDIERVRIPEEASKHLGKPYDFWNFDLNSDTGFYCSKLLWLATFRSLGFAVDGNSTSKRNFWFSPKQLLYTPRNEILLDQGPYAG